VAALYATGLVHIDKDQRTKMTAKEVQQRMMEKQGIVMTTSPADGTAG
jgi:hypothetical protein